MSDMGQMGSALPVWLTTLSWLFIAVAVLSAGAILHDTHVRGRRQPRGIMEVICPSRRCTSARSHSPSTTASAGPETDRGRATPSAVDCPAASPAGWLTSSGCRSWCSDGWSRCTSPRTCQSRRRALHLPHADRADHRLDHRLSGDAGAHLAPGQRGLVAAARARRVTTAPLKFPSREPTTMLCALA